MKTGTPWSRADVEALRKLYLNDHSLWSIAHKMGRTPTAVSKALTRLDIRANMHLTKLPLKLKKMQNESDIPMTLGELFLYALDILKLPIRWDQNGQLFCDYHQLEPKQLLCRVNIRQEMLGLPLIRLRDAEKDSSKHQ